LIHTADWTPDSHLRVPIYNIQLALHPNEPQILYASAYPGGVFRSSDGGQTWNARNLGLPAYAVADPARQGRYVLAITPGTPDVLYVGLNGPGLFKSGDGGDTWQPADGRGDELKEAHVQALLIHPDDPDVVYAATLNGVWRTANGGESWAVFSDGLQGPGDVRSLTLGADGQLYAGSNGYGVYVRNAFHEPGEEGWRQLPALPSVEIAPQPTNGQSAGVQTTLLIHPDDPDTIYAGRSRGGAYKTSDGGLTWHDASIGLVNDAVLGLAIHPLHTQTLYAGTAHGVARSTDAGATWHRWDNGWPAGQEVGSVAFDPGNPDVLYACSSNAYGGTVMKTADGGLNWREITTGLDATQTFLRILVDRFDPATLYLATLRDGLYISRDAGETWNSWNEGLWNKAAGSGTALSAGVLQFSADGRLLYFGTTGSGVWRRPTEGAP
jgi:photosystem II stability/assembly factor-like uncharacterized protein